MGGNSSSGNNGTISQLFPGFEGTNSVGTSMSEMPPSKMDLQQLQRPERPSLDMPTMPSLETNQLTESPLDFVTTRSIGMNNQDGKPVGNFISGQKPTSGGK